MAEVGASYQLFLTQTQQDDLVRVVNKILTPGRGILAVDDTVGRTSLSYINLDAMEKKLSALNLENSEENRRKYKELLFSTPNLGEHVSGVILFDETYRQVSHIS